MLALALGPWASGPHRVRSKPRASLALPDGEGSQAWDRVVCKW